MDKIPEISDERVAELYALIKPVIRFQHKGYEFPPLGGWKLSDIVPDKDDGLLYFIEDVDPYKAAFTVYPKPIRQAEDLEEFDAILTWHTWAYYGFFKPTIAEVLAQIPEQHLERIVAFQTLTNVAIDNIVGNYHVAITVLYERIKR